MEKISKKIDIKNTSGYMNQKYMRGKPNTQMVRRDERINNENCFSYEKNVQKQFKF